MYILSCVNVPMDLEVWEMSFCVIDAMLIKMIVSFFVLKIPYKMNS